MLQPVADRKNGHTVRSVLDRQFVDLSMKPCPDKGSGIVGRDLFDENVPHLVVGTLIFDLVYQLIFHGGASYGCVVLVGAFGLG